MWTRQKINRARSLEKSGIAMRRIANDIGESYQDVVMLLYGGVSFRGVSEIIDAVIEMDDTEGESSGTLVDIVKSVNETDLGSAEIDAALRIVGKIPDGVVPPAAVEKVRAAAAAKLGAAIMEVVDEAPVQVVKPKQVIVPKPEPDAPLVIPTVPLFRLKNKDGAYLRSNGTSFTYDKDQALKVTEAQATEVLSRPAYKNYAKVPV